MAKDLVGSSSSTNVHARALPFHIPRAPRGGAQMEIDTVEIH